MGRICFFVLFMIVFSGIFSSCAVDRKKRAFLPRYKYEQVQELYRDTESIDIVRRILEENQWYEAEINEALYRLRQENEVIEEPRTE